MGKITNVMVNSMNALNRASAESNNFNYYIDWSIILKDNQKYNLTWSYNGTQNFINSTDFPYLVSNFYQFENYITGTNGATSSGYLGTLKFNMIYPNANIGNFKASIQDNSPIYLNNRPLNNNFTIQCLSNSYPDLYLDNYYTVAGTGTATQSGYVLTIVSATTGLITIGTVITISGVPRIVMAFISGTGLTGTYLVSISATVGVATAYTFPQDIDGRPNNEYILTLSFEEIN